MTAVPTTTKTTLKDLLDAGLIHESKDEKLGEMLEKAFEGKDKDGFVDDPEVIKYSLKVFAKELNEIFNDGLKASDDFLTERASQE
ncbi:hypothetical protein GALL_213130 [mine drainage metagenome]|uniref:Uncharacterized protein n=1 Tax=mine drainage metagenome TaxID=410659 RepID=A0A1J5S8Y4_9ZZZZ